MATVVEIAKMLLVQDGHHVRSVAMEWREGQCLYKYQARWVEKMGRAKELALLLERD